MGSSLEVTRESGLACPFPLRQLEFALKPRLVAHREVPFRTELALLALELVGLAFKEAGVRGFGGGRAPSIKVKDLGGPGRACR